MPFDHDMIVDVLTKLENGASWVGPNTFPQEDPEDVSLGLAALVKGGLAEGKIGTSDGKTMCELRSITFAGREYLRRRRQEQLAASAAAEGKQREPWTRSHRLEIMAIGVAIIGILVMALFAL